MSTLQKPKYIDTSEALLAWVDFLRSAEVIAVDTESDSFHHYREKVCLIQMTALGEDAIIDPLALDSLEPIREILADEKRIKIFHDAGYDLACLARDFGFELRGLFDTMVASRLLGSQSFGLAAILRERFNFEANKRLQRSDWARRPLSSAQIDYARFDTHYLEELSVQLTQELRVANRWSWAVEDFARLPEIALRNQARESRKDPDAWWRLRGVRTLSPAVRGRARVLYYLRERIAERLDRPPFKVFSDNVVIDIAKSPPKSASDLGPRRGLRRGGIQRFGAEIFKALEEATPVAGKAPSGSGRRRRFGRFLEPEARQLYETLRELRKEIAGELGIDPEVLLANATIENIAKRRPTNREELMQESQLNGWRGEFLANSVVSLIASL